MNNFWNDLPQPFFALAPMEAVTDVVFRHVVAKAGAPDVWFSEFTNATGWVHAGQKAIGGRLIKTDDENPIVAQIWGGEAGDMEQLALHCKELGYHGIDINMGCPAKSAIKSGGSALIRKPEVAIAAIKAAKTACLPVSVKTRLGYTSTDEWRDWLTTLLEQDIVNLTIHLRTKKEMSKVPAHFELIPDIIALRDQIAPQTLLTINGDIRNRTHGLELVNKYPGINGIMIGRGVFQNPHCFAPTNYRNDDKRVAVGGAAPAFEEISDFSKKGADRLTGPASSDPRADFEEICDDGSATEHTQIPEQTHSDKGELFELLNYHLDLFDQWQPELGCPYETLKRFYKIYIRDFDGAKELRDQLMHTKTTNEARGIIKKATV